MNEADYPRPPTPDHRYEDKPFALRQPPQEILASIATLIAVVGLYLWNDAQPMAQRFALARWVLPLQTVLPALLCFWIAHRAKRTDRPKTARLTRGTAIALAVFSIVAFVFVIVIDARVESALGSGSERRLSPG